MTSPHHGGATPPHHDATTHVAGVLIVGGGYAGVHAAHAARRHGATVTVLDPTGDYDFVPRLAAVAGGTSRPGDARAPLTGLVDAVLTGTATAVGDGRIQLDDGSAVTADAIVVTAGATPAMPPIDGIEHARPLRTSSDAFELRAAIDAAESLVVVGGGATGAQLAGAAADRHRNLSVYVIESEPTLLPGMGGGLGDHARRILEARGVDVRLEATVARIDQDGVELESGERIDGLVAWAAGFSARADDLGVDVHDDGRILVDDQLRIMGMERTFAAGDVALHLDSDRQPLAMSAQTAVQAGSQAGANAARLLAGSELEPSRISHRGWVLDLGGSRGVAQIGPLTISSSPFDRLAPLLHTAVDLKHLSEIGGIGAIRSYRPGAHQPASVRDTGGDHS